MKHYFVLNPTAGKGDSEKKYLPRIIEKAKELGLDYEIHRTINVGDATTYVKHVCEKNRTDSLRFYAIGGDGTVNEVANGLYGAQNAELAILPCGSGNDFVRMFGNASSFRNLDTLFAGTVQSVDAIELNGRILMNMVNIGIDCATAAEMSHLKETTALKGTPAYIAALIKELSKNESVSMKVILDGGEEVEGEFSLVAVGNGGFCGGGFFGVPKVSVVDGLLDISMVQYVNRKRFLRLVIPYHQGKHLESKLVKDNNLIRYIQTKELSIELKDDTPVCVDGEIVYPGRIHIRILPKAIRFLVPEGCLVK